jgi:tape measure domain-containing protein
MDDAILIQVKLDTREIGRAADEIARKLKAALGPILGGGGGGGGRDPITPRLRDQEAAALRLAAAQARLATASGNIRQAETILATAIANTTKQTVAQISAQTQLVRTQQNLRRSFRELGDSISGIGSKITLGIGAPLTALGVAAVKTATDFDSLKRGLTAVSGSATETEKQLIRLKEVAKLPGFGFREAIQGSINLQAAGFSAERAEKALRVFGNALATVGKGKAELDGVILALTQIESKGKVSAEEINQLAERVPQIRQIMIKAFGTADTEVIQRAKITSRQFIDAVVNELAKLPQVTGGARNTFENLRDSIEQSLLPLGNKLLQTILPAIEKLSPKILGLLEGFGKLSSGTQQLVIGFGAAAIAAGPFISALGSLTQAIVALNAAASTGLMARLLRGPVILSAAIVGAIGVQTFREATGNQEMIDLIGGPDQDRIARILKERGQSGADAFMRVAQELKDKALLASLPRPGVNELIPGGDAAQVFQALGTQTKTGPAIDANALAAGNARQKQKTDLQQAQQETKRLTEEVKALRADEGKLFEEEFKQLQLRFEREQLLKPLRDRAFRAVLTAQGKPLPPDLPQLSIMAADARNIRASASGIPGGITGFPGLSTEREAAANQAEASQLRSEEFDQRLRIQEVQIQNQVTAGLISQTEAERALNAVRRESRDQIIATLEEQRKAVGANSLEGLRITEQIEQMRLLGVELSNSERFMRGFNSATESVGDAFERLGQNVSRALLDTKNLLDSLKQAVVQFFNDLLGQSLQNVVRQVLAPIAGMLGGGAGGIGNIFRTPSTFPASVGGAAFQSLATAFAGGGGLGAPPSISTTQQIQQVFSDIAGPATRPRRVSDVAGAATGAAARGGFSLGGILGGLASAAPLLGLSLGTGLGGQSRLGQVLGAGAGLGLGLGISFAAPILAEGGLAALGPAALAFAGPAAFIAAPLIVGAIFAGKAAQRRKDEEASGEFLRQALQQIDQLAAGVGSGQIPGSEARGIFDTQILATFKQQISGLQTKSVRDSRLTNQVRDLENVYQARIPPLIEEQNRRAAEARRFAAIDARLIPQFAIGGISGGGLAILHDREMVLTPFHQMGIQAIAGADIFNRVGVPGVQPEPIFDRGGIMPSGASLPSGPIVIDRLVVAIDSEGMVVDVMSGRTGEQVIVNAIEAVNLRKGRR